MKRRSSLLTYFFSLSNGVQNTRIVFQFHLKGSIVFFFSLLSHKELNKESAKTGG
jgi:hypothetical protein